MPARWPADVQQPQRQWPLGADPHRATLPGADPYGVDPLGYGRPEAGVFGAGLSDADFHGSDLAGYGRREVGGYGSGVRGADPGADLPGYGPAEADSFGVGVSDADLSGHGSYDPDTLGAGPHGPRPPGYRADPYGYDLPGAEP